MKAVLPRVFFGLAVLASLVTASPRARAQSLILQPAGTFYRKEMIRPTGQQPHWISQADCLAKDIISFPVTLTGPYLGNTLQVWAGNQGVDCTQVAERQPGGSAECWQLYSAPATVSPVTVDISAVDIVARILPSSSTSSSTTSSNVPHGTYPDACFRSDAPAGQALTLFFFFVSSGTTIVGMPQPWKDIGYDTSPPAPPTNVGAGSGETRAHLTWTPASSTDVKYYNFYCDPAPGAVLSDGGLRVQGPPLGMLDVGSGGFLAGTGGDVLGSGGFLSGSGGDILGSGGTLTGIGGSLLGSGGSLFGTAGTAGAAGSGGSGGSGTGATSSTGGTTTSTAANCSSTSVLQPNVSPLTPMSLKPYQCGSVTGITANQGTVGHLVNNVPYVFAVSAVDQVGNVGPLSQNACATPANLTDFFELYRQAGGRAGGGICSLSFKENPARTGVLFIAAALGLSLAVRRSRRGRK